MMIRKFQTLLVLLITICLVSCNQYSISDVQGDWVNWDTSPTEFPFEYLKIAGDSIYLQDEYSCQHSGTVSVHDDSLIIKLSDSERYQLPIHSVLRDSVISVDTLTYAFYLGGNDWNRVDFEFIDIEGNQIEAPRYPYRVMWLSKRKDGSVRINVGERDIELSDMGFYLQGPSPHNPPTPLARRKRLVETIFIGSGVTLKDLQILFEYNLINAVSRVNLITRRSDTGYHQGIAILIHSWIENKVKLIEDGLLPSNLPPSPPLPPDYSKKYVLDQGAKEIVINDIEDISNFSIESTDVSTIVTVSSDLSVEDYISVQLKLKRLANRANGRVYCVIE